MFFKVNEGAENIIKNDLHKRYLMSGKRLAGEIKENKIKLFLEDDFGKHSAFMSRCFYGTVSKDGISGKFRASNYVIVLLLILFAVAVESIIAAVILGGYGGIIMPSVIIAAEIFYIVYLKRLSFEHDELIRKYLESL